jgi:hypothetical protein
LFNSGAPAYLQHEGTLAIVSELADVDAIPDKLCEWWSANTTLLTEIADAAAVTAAGVTASAVLVHGVPALTAEQYAARRGGAEHAPEWERHLAAEGIQHMSQGLIFAVRSNATTTTDVTGTGTTGAVDAFTDSTTASTGAVAAASRDTVKRSTLQRIKVVAVDKAWAPENTAALQAVCEAVSRCSNS